MSAPTANDAQSGLSAPQRTGGRGGRWLMLGIVIGLILGGGSVAWAWVLNSNNGATADGATACEILDRMDLSRLEKVQDPGDLIAHRWAAVRAIGNAAAELSPEYVAFSEAITNAHKLLTLPEGADMPAALAQIQVARDRCLEP
ncbi:MAG: hypothetical protein GEU98_23185 [Pseudonocardiaceae bacterium]|nr:hypothetical protein [Pseudonocardiaceae bacterium]